MESKASNNESAGQIPPKPRKKLLLVIGVIAIISVIATLLVANAMIQSTPQATANIQVTSFKIDRSPVGPTTFTVTVSNDGTLSGYGTVYCYVNPEVAGTGAYTNTKTINLDPGSSTTVSIVVETPFGMTVTQSICGAVMQ
jgi:hypothetical protein